MFNADEKIFPSSAALKSSCESKSSVYPVNDALASPVNLIS
jgi:hypothetical protein